MTATMKEEMRRDIARRVVSIPEAGRMLGIGRSLAYKMAKEGTIPTLALGARRIVVPLAALEKMLAECGNARDKQGT